MNIVFPINGIGSRFNKKNYSLPKPLLPVNGKPMLSYVLEHYPSDSSILFIFAAHDSLFRYLIPIVPKNAILIRLSKDGHPWFTNGPAETLLHWLVREEIDNSKELLIADCDSFMEDPVELINALSSFRKEKADGGVTIRRATESWASYAKIENGWVTETREKEPFSEWSTTGPYWWKSGSEFVRTARQSLKEGNFYVSPIYNIAIKESAIVYSHEVKTFTHLGIPEAYESYTHHRSVSVQPTETN